MDTVIVFANMGKKIKIFIENYPGMLQKAYYASFFTVLFLVYKKKRQTEIISCLLSGELLYNI